MCCVKLQPQRMDDLPDGRELWIPVRIRGLGGSGGVFQVGNSPFRPRDGLVPDELDNYAAQMNLPPLLLRVRAVPPRAWAVARQI